MPAMVSAPRRALEVIRAPVEVRRATLAPFRRIELLQRDNVLALLCRASKHKNRGKHSTKRTCLPDSADLSHEPDAHPPSAVSGPSRARRSTGWRRAG